MKMISKPLITIVLAAFCLATIVRADETTSMSSALPPASAKTGVTYQTDIKPIFDANCLKCHDSKKPKQGAKLCLDTLAGVIKGDRDGAVLTPGNSAHSDLVLSVAHVGDPDSYMPRPREAKKLTDDQVGLIRAWIDQGAR